VLPKYVLLSICAFIRVYFWVFGKTFTTFTLQVYTHFLKKLIMINEFFQRKVGTYLFSQACCFLARQFFILIIFFFFLACSFFLFFFFFKLLSFIHLFLPFFFSFSL